MTDVQIEVLKVFVGNEATTGSSVCTCRLTIKHGEREEWILFNFWSEEREDLEFVPVGDLLKAGKTIVVLGSLESLSLAEEMGVLSKTFVISLFLSRTCYESFKCPSVVIPNVIEEGQEIYINSVRFFSTKNNFFIYDADSNAEDVISINSLVVVDEDINLADVHRYCSFSVSIRGQCGVRGDGRWPEYVFGRGGDMLLSHGKIHNQSKVKFLGVAKRVAARDMSLENLLEIIGRTTIECMSRPSSNGNVILSLWNGAFNISNDR